MDASGTGNSGSLSTEELLAAYDIPPATPAGKARARELLEDRDRRRTPARRAALRATVRPPNQSAA